MVNSNSTGNLAHEWDWIYRVQLVQIYVLPCGDLGKGNSSRQQYRVLTSILTVTLTISYTCPNGTRFTIRGNRHEHPPGLGIQSSSCHPCRGTGLSKPCLEIQGHNMGTTWLPTGLDIESIKLVFSCCDCDKKSSLHDSKFLFLDLALYLFTVGPKMSIFGRSVFTQLLLLSKLLTHQNIYGCIYIHHG